MTQVWSDQELNRDPKIKKQRLEADIKLRQRLKSLTNATSVG